MANQMLKTQTVSLQNSESLASSLELPKLWPGPCTHLRDFVYQPLSTPSSHRIEHLIHTEVETVKGGTTRAPTLQTKEMAITLS